MYLPFFNGFSVSFCMFSLVLRITQNPGPTQKSWQWLDIFLFYASDSRWTPRGCPEMWYLPQNYRWKLVELPVAAECRRLQSRWGDLWATAACSWRNSHCTHQHLAVDKPKNLWVGYIKMWTCNGFLRRMIYLHGGFSTSILVSRRANASVDGLHMSFTWFLLEGSQPARLILDVLDMLCEIYHDCSWVVAIPFFYTHVWQQVEFIPSPWQQLYTGACNQHFIPCSPGHLKLRTKEPNCMSSST